LGIREGKKLEIKYSEVTHPTIGTAGGVRIFLEKPLIMEEGQF
jgi:hypothetical protein